MPRKYTPEQAINAFWSRVDKSGGADSCWEWTGAIMPRGYGVARWDGYAQRAHRVSYEIAYGVIPTSLSVLHSCDNRRCVNPDHLFLGTGKDNTADMMRKGRAVHPTKLTEQQVADMRRRHAAGGVLLRELSVDFGVSIGHVSEIVNRKKRLG